MSLASYKVDTDTVKFWVSDRPALEIYARETTDGLTSQTSIIRLLKKRGTEFVVVILSDAMVLAGFAEMRTVTVITQVGLVV